MEGKVVVGGGATVVGFVHFAVFGMAVSLYFFRHRSSHFYQNVSFFKNLLKK